MYEQRIEIKNTFRWFLKQWKILAVGTILIAIVLILGFYHTEKTAYDDELSKRLTLEDYKQELSENSWHNVDIVLTFDEILETENQQLADVRDLLKDTSYVNKQALRDEASLIFTIYYDSQLRLTYYYGFTDEELRCYNLICGIEYTPLDVPTITAHMILQGIIFGFAAILALVYLIYVLGGYLHSEKEISKNFELPVCVIKGKQRKGEQDISFLLETAHMEMPENKIVIDLLGKEKEADHELLSRIEEAFGEQMHKFNENDTAVQKEISDKKNVFILTKINQSKVMNIRKVQKVCKSVDAEVKGIIVITE